MARGKGSKGAKQVAALTHEEATRKNIPTAELQPIAERIDEIEPVGPVRFARRTPLAEGQRRERDSDLDPQIVWNGARIRLSPEQVRRLLDKGEVEIGEAQLVWRGKDTQGWSDLVVPAPPLYIQEKVHPKAIIDDLQRRSNVAAEARSEAPDLFADFNGLLDPNARTEFYQHDQHWSNRMILGDSLQVMASLAQRESLRGHVQCIYFDPPYGIKFNSNWQVSTQSRDVKDGKQTDVSREPEQVKAFRDTWKDGIHSYLTYLRDRLTVARDLLHDSGSIFVQISDDNLHRVRSLLDEVFGTNNFAALIPFRKSSGIDSDILPSSKDFIIWYAKNVSQVKVRRLFKLKQPGQPGAEQFEWIEEQAGRIRRATDVEMSNPAMLPSGTPASTP
jgi:adenine-specific DNA-methyltransferase